LRAVWGLWTDHRNRGGDYPGTLKLAQEFSDIAVGTDDPATLSISDRMVGVCKHYLGDLNGAQHHIERLLNRAAVPEDRSHITRIQFDQQIAAHCFLALILFLRGFPNQAMGLATRNVDEALATNHAISLTYALANGACPVALFISDLAAVEYFVELLLERTARHQLHVWHVLGEYFKGVLLVSRGETGAGTFGCGHDPYGRNRGGTPSHQ
jgi:hypothetical protein